MTHLMRRFKDALSAVLAPTVVLLLAAVGAACHRGAAGGGGKPTIAVIPKAQVNVFWQSVRLGAEAAGKEAGVEIVWAAPQVETDYAGQATIIEDFVNRKVSAV